MPTVSTEFDSILDKYNNAKLNTYKVLELLGTDYTFNDFGSQQHNENYAKLVECGTVLTFSKECKNNTPIYHLTHSNFCRQRICPMCQFRKSQKAFAEALKVTDLLETQGYRFLHLVLTIPNCKGGTDLLNAINLLYKSFNKFYAYKDIKKAFKGALRCLEVSYNYDNDTFHPHLHTLIAVNGSYFNDSKIYLSYDKLRALWSKAVNLDCELQISVRAMKRGDKVGVAEVCKYCMKPLELDDERSPHKDMQNLTVLLTIWHTLKGVRFVQKYGVIKEAYKTLNLDNGEELQDEFITTDIEAQRLSLFWDSKHLKYSAVSG